jgi:hypothetical protein
MVTSQYDPPRDLSQSWTPQGVAGRDVDTPHWSQRPMEDAQGGLRLEQLDWRGSPVGYPLGI